MPILLAGLIWVVGATILVGGGPSQQHPVPGPLPFSSSTAQDTRGSVIAQQWAAWRGAVNRYAQSHLGATPPPPCWSQAQLNLSFTLQSGWFCRVTTGTPETVWAYGPVPPGAGAVAAEMLGNPVNVGLSRGDVLVPPRARNLGISTPAFIPAGALVSVEQIQ
jgi:hypothetical protein